MQVWVNGMDGGEVIDVVEEGFMECELGRGVTEDEVRHGFVGVVALRTCRGMGRCRLVKLV